MNLWSFDSFPMLYNSTQYVTFKNIMDPVMEENKKKWLKNEYFEGNHF